MLSTNTVIDEYSISYYRPKLKYKLKSIKISDSDRRQKILELTCLIKNNDCDMFTFLLLRELTITSLSEL